MSKKKVLIITAGNLGRGGVQMMLLQWLKGLEKEDIHLVWYFPGKVLDLSLESEFHKYDIDIIEGRGKGKIEKLFKSILYIKKILKENSINIVHINTGSIGMQYLSVKCANKYRVDKIIAHSRNTGIEHNLIEKKMHDIMRKYLLNHATDYASCSLNAGEWLFGKSVTSFSNYYFIPNPVDIDSCYFDKNTRIIYREKLDLEKEDILLGAVGKLNEQKNFIFLIEMMAKLEKRYKLLILGEGDQFGMLHKYADDKGISDRVFFMGSSREVYKWLQAMDIFLMPSKWEGFGNAAIEAEAAGLPCILSDKMSREVKIIPNVLFVPIDDSNTWVEQVHNFTLCNSCSDRRTYSEVVRQSQFRFENAIAKLKELYELD